MGISAIGTNPTVNGLEIDTRMKDKDITGIDEQVNTVNKSLSIGNRQIKQQLDKNDFLTLLVAEMKNQDPSNPLDDKQFIAQQAQFSTLEQMNNMSREFAQLSNLLASGQVTNVLGKNVDVQIGEKLISGQVSEVTRGEFPQVLVNGNYYDYKDVTRIRN